MSRGKSHDLREDFMRIFNYLFYIYLILFYSRNLNRYTYTTVKCKYNSTYTDLYYCRMQIKLNLY